MTILELDKPGIITIDLDRLKANLGDGYDIIVEGLKFDHDGIVYDIHGSERHGVFIERKEENK